MTIPVHAALVALSSLLAGNGPPEGTEVLVGADAAACPGASYSTIQAAVDAAPPGTRIRICAGVYREQVAIHKPLSLKGENGAVVMPTGMVANTTSLFDGLPVAAVIVVADGARVDIEDLAVDGSGNAVAACAPVLVGVMYRNASGRLDEVVVRNLRLGPGLEGCQSGLGVLVQSGAGGSSTVEVTDASVHDYQKNGISGNEAGTDIAVRRSVVTGIGPTSGAAQNGIQIGPGARGVVEDCSVANHVWTGCVSTDVCDFVATDILLSGAADARVARNSAGRSQTGVYVQASGVSVIANDVFDTTVFDGIIVYGDGNQVSRNTVTHSDDAGIFLLGNGNLVSGNRIREAPVGIWKYTGSSGNVLEGNRFTNTPTPVLDPPGAAQRVASAFR